MSRLRQNGENEFNKDEKYKQLMVWAIDSKAQARKKMDFYLECSACGFDAEALSRICDEPLKNFSSRATLKALRTGIDMFPWKAVVEENNASIDLNDWDAAEISRQALRHVVRALGSNSNILSVRIKGVRLDFSDGWETKVLDWRENEAVSALPATVAALLWNCTRLSSLDLRFVVGVNLQPKYIYESIYPP